MRHWLSMLDFEPAELGQLVRHARELKRGNTDAASAARAAIGERIMGMVFFNPSLRTRVSFEAAMLRFGGHAIALNVGGDSWNLEHRDGVVMNADRAEHIKEAAPVLSRYCDVLGVRTFAGLKDAEEDARDGLIRAFAKYATVPIVNLESAMDHPCQGLADWMTVQERFGETRGRRFTLTWAPQAKAVPMAVPNAAAICAAAAGMHLTIAHPPEYALNAGVMDRVRGLCEAAGGSFEITHDQRAACADAEVIYTKSWASSRYYGDAEAQRLSFAKYADWMVDSAHARNPKAIFMHCLPVRRNVVMTDAALDDPRCVVVDQAENRMWAQAAILTRLLQEKTAKGNA